MTESEKDFDCCAENGCGGEADPDQIIADFRAVFDRAERKAKEGQA
jgi:hypothetical protein